MPAHRERRIALEPIDRPALASLLGRHLEVHLRPARTRRRESPCYRAGARALPLAQRNWLSAPGHMYSPTDAGTGENVRSANDVSKCIPGFPRTALNSREEGPFIPAGLGIVVVGNRINKLVKIVGACAGLPSQNIRHAHDGTRIHPAAQLRNDRSPISGSPPYRFFEKREEVLPVVVV
jgi:hypothetical protein